MAQLNKNTYFMASTTVGGVDAAAQHDELEAMAAIFDSSVFVAGDGQGSWMYLIRELWCFLLVRFIG